MPTDADRGDNEVKQPRGRTKRRLRVVGGLFCVLGAALLVLAGCARQMIGRAIATSPNAGAVIALDDDPTDQELRARGVDHHRRVDGAEPTASLSMYVIQANSAQPSRGTVVVLHGLRDRKESMVGVGTMFSRAGFDAVLLDLRGHGRSTGDWLTYGVVERHDMVAVVDALLDEGLITEPIGVFGPSYGGAVALQWAEIDTRVKAVVTVSTFMTLRSVARRYVSRFALGIGSLFPRSTVEGGIDLAGELAGFNVDDASPFRAAGSTAAACLFIHGSADKDIPSYHSRALYRRATGEKKLVFIDDATHTSIFGARHWPVVEAEAVAWFERYLAGRIRATADEDNAAEDEPSTEMMPIW